MKSRQMYLLCWVKLLSKPSIHIRSLNDIYVLLWNWFVNHFHEILLKKIELIKYLMKYHLRFLAAYCDGIFSLFISVKSSAVFLRFLLSCYASLCIGHYYYSLKFVNSGIKFTILYYVLEFAIKQYFTSDVFQIFHFSFFIYNDILRY